MKRAKKVNPSVRCCWVCGREGGAGFTIALRAAGYEMQPGEMGYAHPGCMRLAQKRAAKRGA